MKDILVAYLTWKNSISSPNTLKKYTSSVEIYCNMVFGEKPDELTRDDFENLRYSDTINKFVKPLRDKDIKDSTIKSHLIAMRSYLNIIRKEKIFPGLNMSSISNDVFKVQSLGMNNVEHYEPISLTDLNEMEEWLKGKNYFNTKVDNAGEKYAMLIDFMYKTGIRVTATFNITWSDFTLMNSPYGGDWAQLEVLDKGSKLNTKYLTRAYYDKLHRIFYRNNKDEKLFDELSQHSLRSFFKQFSEKKGRHLVIHSLKAGAATTLYAQTKDILLVRDFCDHESVSTTENYIHQQEDPNHMGTAILTENFDADKIDDLSKEQLLMIIHSQPEIENTIMRTGSEFHLTF